MDLYIKEREKDSLMSNGYFTDTTYLDGDWNKVTSSNYSFYQIITYNPTDSNLVGEKAYYKGGQIKLDRKYSNYKDGEFDGKYLDYYESGQVRKDIDYKDGKLNGKRITYWNKGNPKRIDVYENNKLIDGKCFDLNGKEVIYYEYEKMPHFPGGNNGLIKYIKKQIKYPEMSKDNGLSGTVYVSFIIEKDGKVSSVKILRGVNNELDEEAMRVVRKLPKWEPGIQDDEAVRVSYNLPIKYNITRKN